MTPFQEEIQRAFGHAPDATPPGRLVRFATSDRRGDLSGWARLFDDGEGGAFGCWRQGISETWQARQPLTESDRKTFAEKVRAAREQAERARAEDQAECRERSAAAWAAADPADPSHPYLVKKGVKPYLARQTDEMLLVPVRGADGTLHGLQFIDSDGSKRFGPGTAKKGHFCPLGKPQDKTLVIAEGFATGASIHEASGQAVAVAFDAGNLRPVAEVLREKYPDWTLILAADDDHGTEGNPGLSKATEAAAAVGGLLAVPDFTGTERGPKDSDFNDLAKLAGLDEVRRQIEAARPISTPSPTAKNPSDGKSRNRLDVLKGSDVTIEPINWLWHGWLPAGKLTILAGAPGTGKTTIAGELAAILTAGGTWPDGTPAPCADVALWSGEDDPGDTLAPRLLAAGANLCRVHFVRGVTADDGPRPFDPASDISALRLYLAENPAVKLLIVDPISSAVAGDSHKNTEVRRGLQPLVELAAACGVAVLGISHFSKGTSGRDPLERVTGSIAFGALARVVLAAAKLADSEDDQRLFCRSKSNIGPDSGGWHYQLATTELDGFPGVVTSRIQWGAAVEGSARELLEVAEAATDNEERTARSEARHFLTEILSGGPMSAKRVLSEARDCGIAEKTIRRAKTDLAIEVLKTGFKDGWQWSLPKAAKGGQLSTSKKHGHLAHLRDELTTFDAPKMAKNDEDAEDARKNEWTTSATLAGRGDDDCPEFDW